MQALKASTDRVEPQEKNVEVKLQISSPCTLIWLGLDFLSLRKFDMQIF